MGTEYYLAKPSKQELFYLGKHFGYLDGISINEPEWTDYEYFHYFFLDIMDNCLDWIPHEWTFGEILDMLHKIYEWMDAPVLLINDCTDDFQKYSDYKETGSVIPE